MSITRYRDGLSRADTDLDWYAAINEVNDFLSYVEAAPASRADPRYILERPLWQTLERRIKTKKFNDCLSSLIINVRSGLGNELCTTGSSRAVDDAAARKANSRTWLFTAERLQEILRGSQPANALIFGSRWCRMFWRHTVWLMVGLRAYSLSSAWLVGGTYRLADQLVRQLMEAIEIGSSKLANRGSRQPPRVLAQVDD